MLPGDVLSQKPGEAWFERKLRILQFNFEDPYGYQLEKLSPKDVIELAKKVNANTIVIFARDPWGRAYYYGSKIYPAHPKLKTDFMKEIVREAKKNNIRVVAMVAHTSNKWLYERRPDWAQRTVNGEPIVLDSIPRKAVFGSIEWPLMCLNSPFKQVILDEVREALRYDVDAVLLDSFRYQPDFPRACYCRYCREEFKRATGMELPGRPDWNTLEWREAWKWRYNVVLNRIVEIKEVISKTTNKKVPLAYNSHPFSWAGRANKIVEEGRSLLDIVFAENGEADYQPPGFVYEIARLTKALSGGKPVWVSRTYFHVKRTPTATTPVALRQGIWEAVMGDASPWVLIFLSAYFQDKRLFDTIADAYSRIEKIEEYINNVEPLRYAAVVYSNETRDWYARDKPENYVDEVRGFFYSLLYSNIPVDYVSDQDLNYNNLRKYSTLVLANTVCIQDNAVEEIEKYVRDGGGLVATFLASTRREEGYERFEFGLSDTLGLHFYGVENRPWSYIKLDRRHPVTRNIGTNLVLIGDVDYNFRETRTVRGLGDYVRVSPSGSRAIARIVEPLGDYGYEYELGRSPPPAGDETEAEAIVVRKHGAGKSVYFAVQIGRMFWRTGLPEYQWLINNAVKWTAKQKPPIEYDGPETVRVAAYKKKADQLVIHVLNQTYNQRILAKHMGKAKQSVPLHGGIDAIHPPRSIVPVHDINITINILEDGVYSVTSLLEGSCKGIVKARNKMLKINIRKISEYDVIVVSKKS